MPVIHVMNDSIVSHQLVRDHNSDAAVGCRSKLRRQHGGRIVAIFNSYIARHRYDSEKLDVHQSTQSKHVTVGSHNF